MGRLLLGIVIGFAMAATGTLAIHRARTPDTDPDGLRAVHVFQVAPLVLERALPDARVIDVALRKAAERVGYDHDTLYEVTIIYERPAGMKRVVLPFGFAKGILVTPDTRTVTLADARAPVVERGPRGSPANAPPEAPPAAYTPSGAAPSAPAPSPRP
jgi:hypothetical protein